MSDGWHTLKYAGINKTFKYNTNVVLIGNPVSKELRPDVPLKDQVDFAPELMSRCLISMMATPYHMDNENNIIKEKLIEILKITRVNEGDDVKNKKNTFLSEDDLIAYANIVKLFPNPILDEPEEKLIEEFILSIADDDIQKKIFSNEHDKHHNKLDLRMVKGLKIFCKIIARAEFSVKVKPEHIRLAIDIYNNTMVKFRQVFNMKGIDEIKDELIESNKKIYPKSNSEKMEFVLSKIPQGDKIEWSELLNQVTQYAISETELDIILKKLTQDVFEVSPNFYSRI